MIIIGELINSTRKSIRAAMENRDAPYIQDLALRQDKAGADFIDVNAGAFAKGELEHLEWAITQVQAVTKKPLSIDSPQKVAIERGLRLHRNGKPLINSITMEGRKWAEVAPLALEYESYVLGLCIDDDGIPADVGKRVKIAGRIIEGLLKKGKSIDDVWIDPVTTPVSANQDLGIVLLETIQEIHHEFPEVKLVTGLSNVSFGLPIRKQVNRACVAMCLACGLDGALIDPLDEVLMSIVKAAEVILKRDVFCKGYITAYREERISKV